VSNWHGDGEDLSLKTLLRQAQEAFIYGVPFAAIALMRAILEVLLKEQYGSTGADLSELINTARRLPAGVPHARLHRLRKLANFILHPKERFSEDNSFMKLGDIRKNLRDAESFEREVLSYLDDLQTLIEQAPNRPWRN
jgi:hypothetical protein